MEYTALYIRRQTSSKDLEFETELIPRLPFSMASWETTENERTILKHEPG
jgi:hypothetical protein